MIGCGIGCGIGGGGEVVALSSDGSNADEQQAELHSS